MVYKDEPVLREGNFGLADFNTGYLLPAIEAGWEIIGLPVFSKRKPALQFVFVRTDRGIDAPKDLEGKRIATRGYRTALTIFCREGRPPADDIFAYSGCPQPVPA